MIKQIKINETSKAIKSLWGNKCVIQNNIRTNCLKLIEAVLLLSKQRLLCSHLGTIKIFAQTRMELKIQNTIEDERKNKECFAGFPALLGQAGSSCPAWVPQGAVGSHGSWAGDGEDRDGPGNGEG